MTRRQLQKTGFYITAEAVKTAGYDSLDAAKKDGTAFVFMGHGTSHSAKVSYSQMSTQMDKLGYDNVFIGTVEGEPEETSCENVIKAVKDAGYKKLFFVHSWLLPEIMQTMTWQETMTIPGRASSLQAAISTVLTHRLPDLVRLKLSRNFM